MRHRPVAMVALAITACVHNRPDQTHDSASAAGIGMYCQMALAALKETIKPFDAQPYGLEKACVYSRAMYSGKVFVDARFDHHWGRVPESDCTQEDYVIRFDFDHYQRSPSAEVVLLLVDSETAAGRSFNATMEEPNWPSKKPGLRALSACGSAFGTLRRSGSRWTATVEDPPREPDEL
jgi:hypothetical protein